MKKPVDARSHEILCVRQRCDVREHAQVLLVRLVDDRAVQRRIQLLHRAVPIVDPDLDEVGVLHRELANVAPRLLFGRHAVRRVSHRRVRAGVGRRETAPGGAHARTRMRLVAQPQREIAAIGPRARDRSDTVVREAIQLVEDGLAREVLGEERRALAIAKMRVHVDQRRHDGLSCQVDAIHTGRNLRGALPAGAREPAVLDHERGAFDDVAGAGDQAGAFERDGARRPRRLRRECTGAQHRDSRHDCRDRFNLHPPSCHRLIASNG